MIITGVGIFILLLTAVSLLSARKVKGESGNYLVAGRALPAGIVALVLISQPVDSNATLGNADLSATFGFWAGAALPIGLALCLLFMGLFFAKRLRQAQVITLPEYFRNRFGREIELAASVLTVGSFSILLAGNLVAVGLLFEHFVGVSYITGILITVPLALLYTITGGMFASVYTGIAQVVINVVGVASLVVWVGTTYGFSAPGGLGVENLSQLTSTADGAVINWATIIALGLGNLVAIDLMQRIFSAESPRAAQTACFTAAGGILLLCIPLSFVALAAVTIVGDSAGDGAILYTLLGDYAPAWLAIIVLSGLLAATITTVSGVLLSTATVIVHNVLRIDADKGIMTPRMLVATRWSTIPIALLAAVVAMRVQQTGILLTLAFDLLLASLVFPFVLGLYWSRGGKLAAAASIVVGITVRMAFFVLTPTIYGVDNTLLYIDNDLVSSSIDGWSTIIAGLISLTVYVAVAQVTGPSPLAATALESRNALLDSTQASKKSGTLAAQNAESAVTASAPQ